jgi:hypothetical protein
MCLLANPFLHDGRSKSNLACLDRSTGAIDPKKFNSYIGFCGDEKRHMREFAMAGLPVGN